MPKKRKSEAATAPSPMGDHDWQAHSDAEALMRAEEVKGDRGRHSAAQKHLRTKAKTVARALGGSKRKSRKARLESVEL